MNKLKARLAPFSFKIILVPPLFESRRDVTECRKNKRATISNAAVKAVLCGYSHTFVWFVKTHLSS